MVRLINQNDVLSTQQMMFSLSTTMIGQIIRVMF